MQKPGHHFIFLCGLHRSGTSPLFRILREHPEVSGFRNTGVPEDEGQHLQTVFPPAKLYGGPGRFGLAPEAHLTEKSVLITAENRQKLFEEWSRYWVLTRQFLLEKSPPNLIRTRFLQCLFPNSSFIVISRHPIAVSLATWKWAHCSLKSLMEHWLHCHHLFDLDRPHLGHVLTIKYENLIQFPEPTMARIYRFLGLPPLPAPALNPAGNDRYFSAWRKLSEEPRGRATFRHIVANYERHVRRYGYSLVDCNAPVSAISRSIDPQNSPPGV